MNIEEGSVVSMATYLSVEDQQLISAIPMQASHDKAFINKIISFTINGTDLLKMSPKDAVNTFRDSPTLAMIRGRWTDFEFIWVPRNCPINFFPIFSLSPFFFVRAAMFEDRVYSSSRDENELRARLDGFTAAWKKKVRNIYEYERYKCSRLKNKHSRIWSIT